MKPVIDYSIYLVTDTVYFKDDSIYNKLEAALIAGVTLLQYRDKSAETRILYERALKVKALCDKYRVPLIINDRADIAFAVKAYIWGRAICRRLLHAVCWAAMPLSAYPRITRMKR